MTYTIKTGKHSADKDHCIMTWGTLSIDKIVKIEDWVTFYTYSIALYRDMEFNEEFHKAIHTAEHLLAYKEDTWSVRNSLEEVTQWEISGKVILDISPFKTSSDTFGFRITSMIPLETNVVKKLVWLSIQRAINFLETAQAEDERDFQMIPFARPESCGQYNYHNKSKAIADLKNIDIDTLKVSQKDVHTKHPAAYVCDLRFLKPKLEGGDDMVMFSPDFSYRISQLIESTLPTKLPGAICLVGTFGCMTGMYLCVSSEKWDQSDITEVHKAIMEILTEEIQIETLIESEKTQFATLLNNYKNHSN